MDKSNEISQTNASHILSTDKIIECVKLILDQSFNTQSEKKKIYTYGTRLSFCCPYCGDGKDPRKKRGNLYMDSLSFKCYNGGCGIFKDFLTFLYDHGIKNNLTYEEIEEAKNTISLKKSNRRLSGKIDVFLLENYKDILIPRDYYKNKLGLIEIPNNIQNYLSERNQQIDERYLYSPDKRSLHILNLTSDNKFILGLQLRNMNKKAGNKYYTYKLSGIHKNLFKTLNIELIKKAEEIDPISLVFGFSSIDLDSDVTIFEGPFDSFLFPNSVGLCSINNQFPFDISNKRWFYDGDKSGRDELRKKLGGGETVFLWKKFLEENDFPERDKWDLNDVVNYVRSNGKKIKRLEKYFGNSPWDMISI